MVTTESATRVESLRTLTPAAQMMLDALVEHNQWNQTPADWATFVNQGTVYVMRDVNQQIVGSAAVLPFDETIAWISMILVAPAMRGRGFGKALFQQCLRTVRAAGRTAYLDATPAGQRIYRQFGFRELFSITRWETDSVADSATAAQPPIPVPSDISAIAAMDGQALGAKRATFLAGLLARRDVVCVRTTGGFAICRAGRIAQHVGPVVARDEVTANNLFRRVTSGLRGKAYADVTDTSTSLRTLLLELGFRRQRGFVRMAELDHTPQSEPGLLYAIAGPEFG